MAVLTNLIDVILYINRYNITYNKYFMKKVKVKKTVAKTSCQST